jgi:hypothetical protein
VKRLLSPDFSATLHLEIHREPGEGVEGEGGGRRGERRGAAGVVSIGLMVVTMGS